MKLIKILHLEDTPADAELVGRELKKGKLNIEILLVDSKESYEYALKTFSPDIILSDHSLPSFDSHEALNLTRKAGISVPFILVTSTMTDEFAVRIMREGASDYIIKDRLHRLPSAVINAIEKHQLEKDQQKFLSDIIESEAMLREGEKIAHFGTWQTDLQTGKSKWSDEAYRIFDLEPGKIEPNYPNFINSIHAEDRESVERATKLAIETLESQRINFRVLNGDDTIKWVRSELIVECDKKKQPLRIIGFNHDITEIKSAEGLLKKSEANLRAIFDNSDTAYVLLDMHFYVRSFNGPATAWARAELKMQIAEGKNFLTNLHFKKREKMRAMMNQTLAGGRFEFEEASSNTDLKRWYYIHFNPVWDTSKNIIGLYIAVSDITRRKLNEEARRLTEEKLAHSESRLREAQAIAHLGNWEIDISTGTHTWSDEMFSLFITNKETLVPSTEVFLSFIHPEDRAYVKEQIEGASHVRQHNAFDFRFIRTDEATRYGYSEWEFEMNKSGQAVRLFGIIQDVTERKLAEIERTKIVNDLMLRNKDLEQFAYIISHNLRAPVANILGVTTELNHSTISKEERELLKAGLRESVLKLDNVIKDLNIILQSKQEISETRKKVLFSEIVNDIQLSIKNVIENNNIEIQTDFAEVNQLVTLKSYIYSIFYNLISNSIKYRQKQIPSKITIKSYLENDKIILLFTDNGMGIDLKRKGDQVFGLYKRFHHEIEGKGMGLYMVKTQVETLGGKISIESEVNVGTKFKIELEDLQP